MYNDDVYYDTIWRQAPAQRGKRKHGSSVLERVDGGHLPACCCAGGADKMAAGKLPAYRRRLCTVKHCEPRLCGTHLEVLFVVLRDEGRRHLLKAVPKHFRSRMRLALNSRPWALHSLRCVSPVIAGTLRNRPGGPNHSFKSAPLGADSHVRRRKTSLAPGCQSGSCKSIGEHSLP